MSRLTQLVRRFSTPRRRLVPVFAIAIAATAAVTAACGGGGGYGGSSAPSATVAGGVAAAPTSASSGSTPLAGGQPGSTPSAAASGSASGSAQLTVVASNTSFDKSTLDAAAGEVKLTLNNQDGIAHNLHLFKGNDDSGQSIGMTPIEAGPVQNSFTANLAPGTYLYQCDVHPDQMHGTLVVK